MCKFLKKFLNLKFSKNFSNFDLYEPGHNGHHHFAQVLLRILQVTALRVGSAGVEARVRPGPRRVGRADVLGRRVDQRDDFVVRRALEDPRGELERHAVLLRDAPQGDGALRNATAVGGRHAAAALASTVGLVDRC